MSILFLMVIHNEAEPPVQIVSALLTAAFFHSLARETAECLDWNNIF